MNDFKNFVLHLKLEAIALATLMVALTHVSSAPLWVLPVTFLIFDIGMVGYIKDTKLGAMTYNFTHDLTLPTLLVAFGVFFNAEAVAVTGYCWTFHIAVDRALGFGLKHSHSFHATHLGSIKNKTK